MYGGVAVEGLVTCCLSLGRAQSVPVQWCSVVNAAQWETAPETRTLKHAGDCVGSAALALFLSERRGNNLKEINQFPPEAKSRIWHRLSDMCHISSGIDSLILDMGGLRAFVPVRARHTITHPYMAQCVGGSRSKGS